MYYIFRRVVLSQEVNQLMHAFGEFPNKFPHDLLLFRMVKMANKFLLKYVQHATKSIDLQSIQKVF